MHKTGSWQSRDIDQKVSLRNSYQDRAHEQCSRVLNCPHCGHRVGNRFPRQEKQLQSCMGVRDTRPTCSWVVGEGRDERRGWGAKPKVLALSNVNGQTLKDIK